MNLTNTPANTPREDQTSERKSLRVVAGGSADFSELAKDCVCFANGAGGRIFLGIEDGDLLPPPGQRRDGGIGRPRRRPGRPDLTPQPPSASPAPTPLSNPERSWSGRRRGRRTPTCAETRAPCAGPRPGG